MFFVYCMFVYLLIKEMLFYLVYGCDVWLLIDVVLFELIRLYIDVDDYKSVII